MTGRAMTPEEELEYWKRQADANDRADMWSDRNLRQSCIELALRLYPNGIPAKPNQNPATVVLVSARQLERFVRGGKK